MMSPSCGPLPTLGHGRGCSGSVAAHTVGSRLVQCTAAILAPSGSAPVREAASPKAERHTRAATAEAHTRRRGLRRRPGLPSSVVERLGSAQPNNERARLAMVPARRHGLRRRRLGRRISTTLSLTSCSDPRISGLRF